MAIYVYNSVTGALVSYCPSDTDPVADAATLSAKGLTAVSGLPAQDASHQWDATTKTVVSVTPAPPPNYIPSYQFANLFTAAELQAIKQSADANVQKFFTMATLAPQVNLNDPITQNGVNYLVTVGILTQVNANLILAGQSSQ